MNLLFRVICAAHCRSTHHELAMDALRQLRCERARMWRNMFLRHFARYLEGAKAPDKQFKDFRNHVLHVRDNYWGGAIEATERWYEKTVVALKSGAWSDAAYNAGVMSHYYTDPLMPLHTGQSDAENNIHRAMEWSVCRSYDDLIDLVEEDLGYPKLEVPDGDDWLAQMVMQGAETANIHYDELVAEYDLARGARYPSAGLNEKSQRIIAELLAHAAVGLARILDRAIAESRVYPPETHVTFQGFFEGLQLPVRWVAKRMASARESAAVMAMYEELQRTGRIEANLPEGDRTIRDLYQREVVESSEERQKRPRVALASREIASEPGEVIEAIEDLPPPRFYLELESDIVDAPSIGPKTARRLAKIGVETVADLLAIDDVDQAAARIGTRQIEGATIADWQVQATLVCRIPELRGHDAQLLVACGYLTPDDVAGASEANLLDEVSQFAATPDGQRIVRSGNPPDAAEVRDWIRRASLTRTLRAA